MKAEIQEKSGNKFPLLVETIFLIGVNPLTIVSTYPLEYEAAGIVNSSKHLMVFMNCLKI